MAGYNETREKIISRLTGRPSGEELTIAQQEEYELMMLDYIRSLEMVVSSGGNLGIAEEDTEPLEPPNARVFYFSTLEPDSSKIFQNFLDKDGNPITLTTDEYSILFIVLFWNMQCWDYESSIQSVLVYNGDVDGGNASGL